MAEYKPLETVQSLIEFVENLPDGKYTYQPETYPENALSVKRGGVFPEIELSLPDLGMKITRSATKIGFMTTTHTIISTIQMYYKLRDELDV